MVEESEEDLVLSKRDLTSIDIEQLDEHTIEKLKIDVHSANFGYRTLYEGLRKKKHRQVGIRWIIRPVIFVTILLIGLIITSILDGTWELPGSNIGLSEDLGAFIVYLTIFLILLALKYYFNKLDTVFYDLCKNDIIDESKYSFEKLIILTDEAEKFIRGKDWNVKYRYLFKKKFSWGRMCLISLHALGFSLIVFDTIKLLYFPELVVLSDGISDAWWLGSHGYTLIWTRVVYVIIVAYLLPALIWYFMGTIYSLRKIITELADANALKLRPLAPDGAAGLKPLGDLSLSMIYAVALPMMIVIPFMIINPELQTLGTFVWYIVYLSLVVIIFFLPLGSAHDVMFEAKKKELQHLSLEFNRAHKEFQRITLETEDLTEDLEISVTYMEKIGSLYSQVEKMAVWPFDTKIIFKFALTTILPFAAVGVQIMLEWFIFN